MESGKPSTLLCEPNCVWQKDVMLSQALAVWIAKVSKRPRSEVERGYDADKKVKGRKRRYVIGIGVNVLFDRQQ